MDPGAGHGILCLSASLRARRFALRGCRDRPFRRLRLGIGRRGHRRHARPDPANTIFFFLPFLFLVRRYPRSWWLALAIPPLLLAGWTCGSKTERGLWWGYNDLVHEYEKWSQDLGPATAHNAPDPRFVRWEGIDKPEADHLAATATEKIYTENGNAFVLFRLAFHRRLPPSFWITTVLLLIGVAAGIFYVRHRPFAALPLPQLAIFSFCLYMISDLFSPIYRHQYYTVQWFFPLLLAAAVWGRTRQKALWTLAVCLLLIVVHLPLVKMQNTLAEYAIMATLLGFSLFPRGGEPSKTGPVSLPKSAKK